MDYQPLRLGMMCGLPRSGKSTFAKRLAQQGWARECADDYRLALHGQAYLPNADPIIWAMIEVSARAKLIGGQSVIIDATNTTRRGRDQWVRLARQQGVEIVIFWVPTPLYLCVDRNRGEGSVPDDVMRRMYRQFEPPSRKEGLVLIPLPQKGFIIPHEE